ncbi:putative integral membrane protein [Anopheles sinensis]|uniref:Putative integral membrane protein n=1 Tax=Anopheles sinensis TaxID=74873 RepID=A0A084W1C6_ANOSI|nr:putative integral membrane protein [Anopheles sinensis]
MRLALFHPLAPVLTRALSGVPEKPQLIDFRFIAVKAVATAQVEPCCATLWSCFDRFLRHGPEQSVHQRGGQPEGERLC